MTEHPGDTICLDLSLLLGSTMYTKPLQIEDDPVYIPYLVIKSILHKFEQDLC